MDPDLAGRYVRGRELAEDLDRWRTTRPLVFAVEPYWRYTVPRALKRWRRPLLAAAAALFVVVGLPSTALVIFNSWRTLEDMAQDKLERHWDEVEVYRFRRSNLHWLEDSRNGLAFFQALEPNDSSTLETAGRALKNYGVFDPGDWRQREDVRNLPHADREELELWLLEQTFRYCLALSEHSDSREDWLRARNLLEQLGEVASLPIFTTLGERLDLKLGIATSNPSSSAEFAARSISPGRLSRNAFSLSVSEYLMGVAAECDIDESTESQTQLATRRPDLKCGN